MPALFLLSNYEVVFSLSYASTSLVYIVCVLEMPFIMRYNI